jgi:hypothetical protein
MLQTRPCDRGILKDRHARIIIECPESILHLEVGYIYADCPFAQLQPSCSPAADHTFATVTGCPIVARLCAVTEKHLVRFPRLSLKILHLGVTCSATSEVFLVPRESPAEARRRLRFPQGKYWIDQAPGGETI